MEKISEVNFRKSIFRKSIFGSQFFGSQFSEVHFSEVHFSEVYFSEVHFSEVYFSEVYFRKSIFWSPFFGSPFLEVNFQKSILRIKFFRSQNGAPPTSVNKYGLREIICGGLSVVSLRHHERALPRQLQLQRQAPAQKVTNAHQRLRLLRRHPTHQLIP